MDGKSELVHMLEAALEEFFDYGGTRFGKIQDYMKIFILRDAARSILDDGLPEKEKRILQRIDITLDNNGRFYIPEKIGNNAIILSNLEKGSEHHAEIALSEVLSFSKSESAFAISHIPIVLLQHFYKSALLSKYCNLLKHYGMRVEIIREPIDDTAYRFIPGQYFVQLESHEKSYVQGALMHYFNMSNSDSRFISQYLPCIFAADLPQGLAEQICGELNRVCVYAAVGKSDTCNTH